METMNKPDIPKQTQQHGGEGWYWDNFGGGWRMACLCGFVTAPDIALSGCGEEMDEHLYAEGRR